MGIPCVWNEIDGKPASWDRGHFVMAAHHDHTKNEHYDEPNNGTTLCQAGHMIQSFIMGEPSHVRLLKMTTTNYHHKAMQSPDEYGITEMVPINDVLEFIAESDHPLAESAQGALNICRDIK